MSYYTEVDDERPFSIVIEYNPSMFGQFPNSLLPQSEEAFLALLGTYCILLEAHIYNTGEVFKNVECLVSWRGAQMVYYLVHSFHYS